MQFTNADLQEYIHIWREEFHEAISMDEARRSASMLMDLYALLVEPLPAASSRSSDSS